MSRTAAAALGLGLALAFLASLVAFAVSVVYGQTSGGAAVMGTTGVVFSAVIFLLGLGFVMYSRMMTRKGVLR